MEKDAIEKIIVDAYINGIHGNQDEKAIRKGFHEDFCMFVKDGEDIQKVTVEKWLQRIEEMKRNNPELWKGKTTYAFKFIDITGNAACT